MNYLGASSMWAWQFAEALDTSDRLGLEKFVSMQNHYNLAYREEEREMIPALQEPRGRAHPLEPARPGVPEREVHEEQEALGQEATRATPSSSRGSSSPADFDVLDRVLEVAKEKGVTPAQVALAWVLHRPGVVVAHSRA